VTVEVENVATDDLQRQVLPILMGPQGRPTAATPASGTKARQVLWKGVRMSASSTRLPAPEGPGSV
jgi:hypothetical protein